MQGRSWNVVTLLFGLAACSGTPTAKPAQAPAVGHVGSVGWEPSHAEIIDDVLAREGARLRAVPGVLVVNRSTELGEEVLYIALCDPAQVPLLHREQIEVPVFVDVVKGAGGKECGCDWDGTYYEPGVQQFPCNSHTCEQGQWTQHSNIDCGIQFPDKISFAPKRADLTASAGAAIAAMVPTFRDHPDLLVAVHGSRTKKEPRKLAMQRAQAIVDALVAAGVGADQLTALDDGDSGRVVQFDVLVQPAGDEP
jgi:hypothetical protein